MRRTLRTFLCLCIGLTLCWALAFWSTPSQKIGAAAPEVEPDHGPPEPPNGEIQAEATVVEEEILPRQKTLKNWVIRFQVTKVLKGQFGESELRFVVHSPSQELGLRGGVGERGVLHGYRRSGRYVYEFVPSEGRRWAGRAIGAAPVH
jgi:hypothetical protein